ncbi:MAG: phosphate ABC transporter permease PstA [Candidatus Anammoxibacter sp.]
MYNNILYRTIKDKSFKALIILFSFIATLPLFFILFYILKKGFSCLSWSFIVNLPKPVGEVGGGISNAIIGTLILISLACLFSIPTGIASGIYLAENRDTRLSYILRLCVEILHGIPSIVIGIAAYAFIVIPMGGFSAISGSVALGIMMVPSIVRSTEETLKLVPETLKEASMALGVSYPKTILKVILPSGLSGIVTGILLSMSRVAGETAPLLFTAFGNPFMSLDVMKPINSLPTLIFNYAASPYTEWQNAAWGASAVLIILILIFNLTAKLIIKKWKVQF